MANVQQRQNSPLRSTSNPLDGGNLDAVRKIDSLSGTRIIEKHELDTLIDTLMKIE